MHKIICNLLLSEEDSSWVVTPKIEKLEMKNDGRGFNFSTHEYPSISVAYMKWNKHNDKFSLFQSALQKQMKTLDVLLVFPAYPYYM